MIAPQIAVIPCEDGGRIDFSQRGHSAPNRRAHRSPASKVAQRQATRTSALTPSRQPARVGQPQLLAPSIDLPARHPVPTGDVRNPGPEHQALGRDPRPFSLAPKTAARSPFQNLDPARVAVCRAVQIAAHFVVQSCIVTAAGLSGISAHASGCDSTTVAHRPRLLSDNGSSYISGDLAAWLEQQGMDHVRGAPNHPQTQGKIERWHQTLKNRILLENYYLPGELEEAIGDFVEHYNHHRYHEGLGNLTSADVYFGRADTILRRRKEIKQKTIEKRRLLHRQTAA